MFKVILKINGVPTQTLTDRIKDEVESAKEVLNKASREVRRSKHFGKIIALVTSLGVIGSSSVTHAATLDSNISVAASSPIGVSFFEYITDKIASHIMPEVTVPQENSGMWQLNNYLTKHLFTNTDMFSDPAIIGMFHTIWGITLSFTTLMIGKKGYDMVKSRLLGAQSQGSTEFIIRLLASGLVSFLSLDLISIGIKLSNLTTAALMHKMSAGFFAFTNAVSYVDAGMGAIFWMVGFMIMFAILGIRYWARQINLVILGLMTPIASMAGVVDGGAMMTTLVKEVVLALTTPLAQAGILGVGTTILMKVGTIGEVGIINALLIGLSTMCLMFVTPDFLRKFITGSFNPVKTGLDMFLRLKTMPLQMLRSLK
jgi:hypothetical protein